MEETETKSAELHRWKIQGEFKNCTHGPHMARGPFWKVKQKLQNKTGPEKNYLSNHRLFNILNDQEEAWHSGQHEGLWSRGFGF